MVVGDSKESVISLPKGEGIRLSLIEERNARLGQEADEEEGDDESDN